MRFNSETDKIDELIEKYPFVESIQNAQPLFWENTKYKRDSSLSLANMDFDIEDMKDAEARLLRFAPYLMMVFESEDSLKTNKGIIESELRLLNGLYPKRDVYLKMDSHLPISGSIKARGGIYEVLFRAEKLALEHGMLTIGEPYTILAEEKFTNFYSQYEIVVGSTGNLGMSIGIMGAKLGFRVVVHMSKDAKVWKKSLLKEKGVIVVEHESDYSKAVEVGRRESEVKDNSFFIDDEKSELLFLGYSVAALRLKKQLDSKGICVDEQNQLCVYIPCGVGGAPGGITFGLKTVFGDYVNCFFVEPTHSPCMLLSMVTEEYDNICVQDIGLDNVTEADGLAVGRASGLVSKMMDDLLVGISTTDDDWLLDKLNVVYKHEGVFLEPSALAGFRYIDLLDDQKINETYIKEKNPVKLTHIVWATGGNMVPEMIKSKFIG